MSTPDPLTTPRPPYDRFTARRGDDRGGRDPRGQGYDIRPGLVDGVVREGAGADINDRGTSHQRTAWYHRDYMTGSSDTLVNWSQCGPIRPSLRSLQSTINKQVGSDATRNFDPRPIQSWGSQDQGHGMHTNPQPSKRATNQRFRETVQMQPARVNRLTSARYNGQSFSQTTRVQGG